MTKKERSSSSLNYTCGRAEKWLKALPVEKLSLDKTLEFLCTGYRIADDTCGLLSLTLARVIAQAQGPITEKDCVLRLHSSVQDAVDSACQRIFNDETRWTTKSRSRFGYRLIQVIATIARTGDLSLIERISFQQKNENIKGLLTCTPVDASAESIPDTLTQDSKALLANSMPGRVDHFRDSLARISVSSGNSDVSLYIPHNFSIDLQGLRRLTNLTLGPVKQRHDVIHRFEPATPRVVIIDQSNLRPSGRTKNCVSGLDDDSENADPTNMPAKNSAAVSETKTRMFPTPQWSEPTSEVSAVSEKRYAKTIAFIKRNKSRPSDSEQELYHTYGVLRTAEAVFSQGISIILTGISGTGKSTFLSALLTGTAIVFEIGSSQALSGGKRYQYKMSEIDDMLKKARRTPGRKILFLHEFFVDKSALVNFGVFDQFAFVGDPRQPGAGNAQHLFDFIRDIGGRRFTLPVVWRVGHPLSTMVANYFAYGSQFKLCERSDLSKNDRQFDLIEADDDAMLIAECMVSYSIEKAAAGKTVIITAASSDIMSAIDIVFRNLGEMHANIQCRQMEDLQGREADVLVLDLHDVAVKYQEPDQALRYVIMLLGRARLTTSVVIGSRNMAKGWESALPIEVIFGVLLRFRVRSREMKNITRAGFIFRMFSETHYLSMIDENTIKIGHVNGSTGNISIIKNRNGHNVNMMENHQFMIEAPSFFDETANLEIEIKIIHRFLKWNRIPRLSVFTLQEIDIILSKNGQ